MRTQGHFRPVKLWHVQVLSNDVRAASRPFARDTTWLHMVCIHTYVVCCLRTQFGKRFALGVCVGRKEIPGAANQAVHRKSRSTRNRSMAHEIAVIVTEHSVTSSGSRRRIKFTAKRSPKRRDVLRACPDARVRVCV